MNFNGLSTFNPLKCVDFIYHIKHCIVMSKFIVLLFSISSILLLNSCGGSGLGETATSGGLNIGIDETLEPIGDAEVDVFKVAYQNAQVMPLYKSEAEIIAALLSNQVSTALLTRQLTPEENKVLEERKIKPVVTPIATDALVLLINKNNPNANLSYKQLLQILSGEATDWKQLNNKQQGKINLVFDNAGSSIVNNVLKLTNTTKLPANSYAVKTNTEVIAYVAKNQNGLGITSLCWLGDDSNDSINQYYSDVNVLAIGKKDAIKDTIYYQPTQENLVAQNYPLQRPIMLINRESRAGLATGFAAFAASERGQRIVLSAGLFPHYMPTREIILKKGF